MKYLGQLKLARTSPQGVSQTKKFWAIHGRMVEKVSDFIKSNIPTELYFVLNFSQQRYIKYLLSPRHCIRPR